ncbi:MAG: four helix bundle protein [Bacteroidota bacterium]
MDKFDIEKRLLEYSLRIVKIVEQLPNTKVGNHIADQLIRSGTSPSFNYAEAQGAESRNDFVHKLKICLKELRESLIALKMIDRLFKIQPDDFLSETILESNELISIFVKSILTAEKNKRKS